MQKSNPQNLERLLSAIMCLKNKDECRSFLEDICTFQEIEAIAQRLEVACLVSSGKSYSEVNKLTGASTTTICRVGKCLNYGTGGYKTVIDRLGDDNA